MKIIKALIALVFIAPTPTVAASIEILSKPLTTALAPSPTPVPPTGRLTYLRGVELSSQAKGFGGFSALHIDKGRLTALSDKGRWLNARFDPVTLKLSDSHLRKLKGLDGKKLRKKENGDAESIALAPDGSFEVSFERRHRVWRYAKLKGQPVPVKTPAKISTLPSNKGIEAMTRLLDGRLMLLAEGKGEAKGWVGRVGVPGVWKGFRYGLSDGFKPTGAATLPSGNVLILERDYSPLSGVAIRLREMNIGQLDKEGLVDADVIGELQPPIPLDNFEGISVAKGERGEILVYLLSDDNFSALQRTLLLVFELKP